MDCEGTFNYVENPVPFANKPKLKPAPPYVYDNPPLALKANPGNIRRVCLNDSQKRL